MCSLCACGCDCVHGITPQAILSSILVWNPGANYLLMYSLARKKECYENLSEIVVSKSYSKTFFHQPSLKVYTESRQIPNLYWHQVTIDDARTSNTTGDWLCRSPKAAPAPQWILGIRRLALGCLLKVCNMMPISLKLAMIAFVWRSKIYS